VGDLVVRTGKFAERARVEEGGGRGVKVGLLKSCAWPSQPCHAPHHRLKVVERHTLGTGTPRRVNVVQLLGLQRRNQLHTRRLQPAHAHIRCRAQHAHSRAGGHRGHSTVQHTGEHYPRLLCKHTPPPVRKAPPREHTRAKPARGKREPRHVAGDSSLACGVRWGVHVPMEQVGLWVCASKIVCGFLECMCVYKK
jgi:hypothetical protein